MFENILVPISSNFIPERAIERTKFFIDNFKSKIIFLYIAESKTVNKISMGSTHALTPKLIEDIKKEEKLVKKSVFIGKFKLDYDNLISSLSFAGDEIREKQKADVRHIQDTRARIY